MPRSECDRFVAFEYDPGVCDSCGRRSDEHRSDALTTPERTKALWRTLLRLGGPHSYYSGSATYVDRDAAQQMREHMSRCEVDWARVDEPQMINVSCFVDTFSDSSYQDAFGGELTCKCGRFVRMDIVTPDLSLGQLIWHAVRDGDWPEN